MVAGAPHHDWFSHKPATAAPGAFGLSILVAWASWRVDKEGFVSYSGRSMDIGQSHQHLNNVGLVQHRARYRVDDVRGAPESF